MCCAKQRVVPIKDRDRLCCLGPAHCQYQRVCHLAGWAVLIGPTGMTGVAGMAEERVFAGEAGMVREVGVGM